MPSIPLWSGSPEMAAAKKIVADAGGRAATVKADIARMKPKLSQYKRETLEKLLKESLAQRAAATKAHKAVSDKEPELAFIDRAREERKKLIDEVRAEATARVAAIDKELDLQTKAAGDHRRGGNSAYRAGQDLVRQYDELVDMVEREFGVVMRERSRNSARRI